MAALLLLTTAGLVTLAAVTYAEQRSFLLDGVDKQARDAQRAVAFELGGGGPPLGRPHLPPPPGAGIPGGIGDGDGGGSGPQGLEQGTYGQLRASDGTVLAATTARSYGEAALPAPKLPASIPLDNPITVGAAGGSSLRYRVLAEPTRAD